MVDSQPIVVQTNVRQSIDNDDISSDPMIHCHSTFDGDWTFLDGKSFDLLKKAQLTVLNTALTQRFRRLSADSYHRPSKDSLLIGADSHPDCFDVDDDVLQATHQHSIVTMYEGPVEPSA
jgi:hypothetical protein